MTLLPEFLTGPRQLILRQAGQLEASGLKVDVDPQRDIVKNRRDRSGDHDGAVGNAEVLCHDEGGGAITGGMIWPPVEATASTAPAKCAL